MFDRQTKRRGLLNISGVALGHRYNAAMRWPPGMPAPSGPLNVEEVDHLRRWLSGNPALAVAGDDPLILMRLEYRGLLSRRHLARHKSSLWCITDAGLAAMRDLGISYVKPVIDPYALPGHSTPHPRESDD